LYSIIASTDIASLPSCQTKEKIMTSIENQSETFTLGDRTVKRLGYGAMQLAGPGVFGPPKDHDAALAVLREAVERGVNHIDTSDFYGPHMSIGVSRCPR
jgi:pyridoxine 4-dehydrogenase